MSWSPIKLSTVSPQPDTIAEGKYTFQLSGAAYDERDPSRLNVRAKIASDGPFKGRQVYFSYPDPEKVGWVVKNLKKLEIALGVDQVDEEDIAAYLNRATGSLFVSNIQHRKYTPEGGNEVTKAELNIFNVEPGV